MSLKHQRQIKDGMCWESESELYNDGSAFKLTCRDKSGIIFTLIADNYYGYCKKEVKTQTAMPVIYWEVVRKNMLEARSLSRLLIMVKILH